MISPAVVEMPGRWRSLGVLLIVALAVLPHAVLVVPAVGAGGRALADAIGPAFTEAAARSIAVAVATAIVSLIIGVPAGVLAGLYDFPMRRVLLGALALPLLVPSFLWAIGLSMFRIEWGLARDSIVEGWSGCVLAFAALGVPMVTYASLLATRSLSVGQVGAARLAGGEPVLWRYAARHAVGPALLAALLTGVLTLSDPGPGQILGYPGVATQVLVSFAARYDFGLAARQSAVLAVIVLLLLAPFVWPAARFLSSGLLGRDVALAPLRRTVIASVAGPSLFIALIAVTALLPLAGVVSPVLGGGQLARAWEEVVRTGGSTVMYAGLAGLIAASLGGVLAICAGRSRRGRATVLATVLVVFALPPSLGSLSVAELAAGAPAWADAVLRSRVIVPVVLALRFLPVATVLAMRGLDATSPSWAEAAAVHGIPLRTYVWRILLPAMAPALMVAGLVVALLASADVSTVLVLQPPGQASLAVAIFTVMANAPESLVASLCALYIAGAAVILMAGWRWAGGRREAAS